MQSKKSVEKQLGFLGSIGSSEMEQEVQKRVETVTKNFVDKMERDTGILRHLMKINKGIY